MLEHPENVRGLIRPRDGRFLEGLAASVPPNGAIVEIGAFTGKSTCFLARGALRSNARVWAIDPWELLPGELNGMGRKIAGTREEAHRLFRENVKKCGFADRIFEVQAFSHQAAERWPAIPIDLIHIDGLHTYPGVKQDIADWAPRLAPGGLIAFDDYSSEPIRRTVRELLAGGGFALADRLMKETKRFGVVRKAA